ncbi:MAG TPA: type II secretion system protein [Pirellulales bacterium]|jgi:type II secretory pathway pseudopilin PulG|nr:type II secretion system protein [Pirellulales bacterium]
MELVVVMVILIALAGMLLPLFPNMLNRAHTSSSATSGAELSKAIQTYQALYYTYPNLLDNLVIGTSTFSYLLGFDNSPSGNLYVGTLTDGTDAALSNVGLNYAAQVAAAATAANGTGSVPVYNPTFFPYNAIPALTYSAATSTSAAITTPIGAGTTLTSGMSVAMLGTQSIADLALTQGASYVVFGVGSYTTMSGKTIDDAPVHFDDDPTANPNLAYARFGVLFQVTDYTGAALPQALYAGAVSFHPLSDGGVVGTDAHIEEYFNNISVSN